ncbi:MAG TPA: S-methyl-5-thioribose-1-phosphate isomerase [Chloroflexota bacterium]|nr:S-methyl-5-thioribose-1-phosphate isomerase [Chloroflexota bacterium]
MEWHAGGEGPGAAGQSPEVWLIDQTRLPLEEVVVRCRSHEAVAEAIRSMRVRGAPAIGVAAAMGVALAAWHAASEPAAFAAEVEAACTALEATRPTAVNLFWAVERMRRQLRARAARPVNEIKAALVDEARRIAAEDVQTCRRLGEHGAVLFGDGDGVLTHCNAGALACVDFGTALSPLRLAHEQGRRLHVFVDETRPFLQGARLTAWELVRLGIDCTLITDNMAAYFMGQGRVQKVIVGADRVAANGDVANKIGTYGVAILARAHGIPFYVAAPTSSIDLAIASGEGIPIEERDPAEVTHIQGRPVAPPGVRAAHPAFDVTPHRYVTAFITEHGIVHPPYDVSLKAAVQGASRPPPAGGTGTQTPRIGVAA